MKSEYSENFEFPFVVGKENLKKLHSILTSNIGDFKIQAECADKITRDFQDLEELENYENSPKKKIKSLLLKAGSRGSDKYSSIRFDTDSLLKNILFFDGIPYRPIRIGIEGPNEIVEKVKNDLFEIILGFRPWYSFFAKINFLVIFPAIAGTAYFGLLFIKKFDIIKLPSDLNLETSFFDIYLGIMLWVFIINPISSALNFIRSKIFPYGVILIGQETDKYKTAENMRWVVFIGLALPLIGSLILKLLG